MTAPEQSPLTTLEDPDTNNAITQQSDFEGEEEDLEVERVLHEKYHEEEQTLWYLVKWVGLDYLDSFFYPASAVQAFPHIMSRWEQTKHRRAIGEEAPFDEQAFMKAQAERQSSNEARQRSSDGTVRGRQAVDDAQGGSTLSHDHEGDSSTGPQASNEEEVVSSQGAANNTNTQRHDEEPRNTRPPQTASRDAVDQPLPSSERPARSGPFFHDSQSEHSDEQPIRRRRKNTQLNEGRVEHEQNEAMDIRASPSKSLTQTSNRTSPEQQTEPAQPSGRKGSTSTALSTIAESDLDQKKITTQHLDGPGERDQQTVNLSDLGLRASASEHDCPSLTLVDSSDEDTTAESTSTFQRPSDAVSSHGRRSGKRIAAADLNVEPDEAQGTTPQTPSRRPSAQMLPGSASTVTSCPSAALSRSANSSARPSVSQASTSRALKSITDDHGGSPVKIKKPKRPSKQGPSQYEKQLYTTMSECRTARKKAAQELSPNPASLTFLDIGQKISSKPIVELVAESQQQANSSAPSSKESSNTRTNESHASGSPVGTSTAMQLAGAMKYRAHTRPSTSLTPSVQTSQSADSSKTDSPIKSSAIQGCGTNQAADDQRSATRATFDKHRRHDSTHAVSKKPQLESVVQQPSGFGTLYSRRWPADDAQMRQDDAPKSESIASHAGDSVSRTRSDLTTTSIPVHGDPYRPSKNAESSFRESKANTTCHYWSQGRCSKGKKCQFRHDDPKIGPSNDGHRSLSPFDAPRGPRASRPSSGSSRSTLVIDPLLKRLFPVRGGMSLRCTMLHQGVSFSCELGVMFAHEKYEISKQTGIPNRQFAATKISLLDFKHRVAASVEASDHLPIGLVTEMKASAADILDSSGLVTPEEVAVIEGDLWLLVVFVARAKVCEALRVPWHAVADSCTMFRLLSKSDHPRTTASDVFSSLRLYSIVTSDVVNGTTRGKSGDQLMIFSAAKHSNAGEQLTQVFKALGYRVIPRSDLRAWRLPELNIVLHGHVDPSSIPGLGNLLRRGLEIKVIGLEDDGLKPLQPRTMFPFSEVVLLTDDVIVHRPDLAAQVMTNIKQHQGRKRTELQPHGRLVTRPGVKAWLISLLVQSALDANGDHDALYQLWKAYAGLCPESDEDVHNKPVPGDNALLVSLDEQCWPSYAKDWDSNPRQGTSNMMNWFAAWTVLHKYEYRQFVVLYTDYTSDAMMLDEHGKAVQRPRLPPWASEYHHLQVMTAEEWLEAKRKQMMSKK